MIKILLKPMLALILLFGVVAIAGITLWLIKDLWLVIFIITAVFFFAKVLRAKEK